VVALANASGIVIDTPKAFTNPALAVTKEDPKARYPLVKHAVEAFGGGCNVYDLMMVTDGWTSKRADRHWP
jgi:hypothetical protein